MQMTWPAKRTRPSVAGACITDSKGLGWGGGVGGGVLPDGALVASRGQAC